MLSLRQKESAFYCRAYEGPYLWKVTKMFRICDLSDKRDSKSNIGTEVVRRFRAERWFENPSPHGGSTMETRG